MGDRKIDEVEKPHLKNNQRCQGRVRYVPDAFVVLQCTKGHHSHT